MAEKPKHMYFKLESTCLCLATSPTDNWACGLDINYEHLPTKLDRKALTKCFFRLSLIEKTLVIVAGTQIQ